MIASDFHVHTSFCDGKDTPEAMVQRAVELGMESIGFSGHAYTSFDDEWCMSVAGTLQYKERIAALKEQYGDRIKIYCGAEWDLYSDGSRDGFEYLIGSVHYVERKRGMTVDESPEAFRRLAEERYNGDFYRLCEQYYANVSEVIDVTGADIIGHFDLVTKFNEGNVLFDTHNDRYVNAWQAACDRLLKTGKPFEINTGAITRGYRKDPYPSADIIDYIGSHGGSFILSSDSHSASSLLYGFDGLEKMLRAKGYRLITSIF